MIKICSFILAIMVCHISLAGGNSALASVKSFQKISPEVSLVEIEWVKEKGLIANNKETKLRFELHKWPEGSVKFFDKMLSWIGFDFNKGYPKVEFDGCLSFLEKNYIKKQTFNLGQMGTVEFRKDSVNPDQIIVPYAKVVKEIDGQTACLIYAAPI